jgi:TusA-related sulfurtransferase
VPPSADSSSNSTASSSGNETAETLDLRGEVCPYTFVRTKVRLEQMAIGSRLRVVVDYEPASRNIPRSVREWGQEVASVTALDGAEWEILRIKRVSC